MAMTSETLGLTLSNDGELLSWCEGKFNESKNARLIFERQWYTNLAFYFGKQWAVWQNGGSSELNRLVEPPAPSWRVRMVINRTRSLIRSEIAKVVKESPNVFVIPQTSDDDDLLAARAGEATFEHVWRELHGDTHFSQCAYWLALTGNGFLKDWWDKTAEDGDLPGKIAMEAVSPFHIFLGNVQEYDLEKQPYIIHSMSKDVDWINDLYGTDLAPDTNSYGDVLEQKFLSALGVSESSKNSINVREMWIKPCGKFPDGAIVTWAASKILYVTEGWPYSHGEYPFSQVTHIPTGRAYGESTIVDLIAPQKEFNRTRSQLIEAKNRMAKPQLIAPRGSIDPTKITSEPGLIITYTPGYQPPQPIPLTAIPAYVTQELERCLMDMDDIAGQHEISRGQTPPGVTAATAISFLSEQDESKLALTIESKEACIEKIGKHILSHAGQFWDSKRTVKVLGDSNTYEAELFKGSDFKGNTDLHVESGSAMPRSRAAKQAFITELGKMGWLPPDRALRYLDMAETGRMYEETQIDNRQQQRENVRMTRGEVVPVNDWDNHQVHMQELNMFRKKQTFEKLSEQIKIQFQQHYLQHSQLLAYAQGAQILPGEPVPPPGLAPPGEMPPGGGEPGAPPPGGPNGPPSMPPQQPQPELPFPQQQ